MEADICAGQFVLGPSGYPGGKNPPDASRIPHSGLPQLTATTTDPRSSTATTANHPPPPSPSSSPTTPAVSALLDRRTVAPGELQSEVRKMMTIPQCCVVVLCIVCAHVCGSCHTICVLYLAPFTFSFVKLIFFMTGYFGIDFTCSS